MDEKELISRAQKGDSDAFSALILPHEKRMYHYALRMLKDSHEAEDALQEAFLKAYSKLNTYHGEASFSTWLYTILNRLCLDILRKKKRTGEENFLSLNQTNKDEEDYELQIEANAPTPEEAYHKKEAMQAVKKALDQLSEEHRAVIVMRDVNGLDYDAIAKITGTSLGTVKSRINRARLNLRKILEEKRELFL